MNIQSLRYFAEIAQGETVSRVAERFFITQPALSRSIQRLEGELKCKLFDRDGPALRLTPQGAAILPIARQILLLAEDLNNAAQDYACGRNSLLSIGCCGSESAVFYELVELIRLRYPAMKIETPKYFALSDLVTKVLNKEIDCCFLYSGYDYGDGGVLESIPLQQSRMQLLVAKSHPFASMEKVSLEQLTGEDLLLWRRDMFPACHDYLYGRFHSCGLSPRVVGTFVSKQEMFSKVAAGEGIAVIHSTETYHLAPFAFVDLVMPDLTPVYQGCVSLAWNRFSSTPSLPLIISLIKESLGGKEKLFGTKDGQE